MKPPFALGDVLLHKLDDRKVVVIGYTYPLLTGGTTDTPPTYVDRKGKKSHPDPIGVRVRTRDLQNGNLTQINLTFHELRKPSSRVSKPVKPKSDLRNPRRKTD